MFQPPPPPIRSASPTLPAVASAPSLPSLPPFVPPAARRPPLVRVSAPTANERALANEIAHLERTVVRLTHVCDVTQRLNVALTRKLMND
jgi:hypothetical protein